MTKGQEIIPFEHEAKPVDVPTLERIASTRSKRRECLVPGGFVITLREVKAGEAEINLIEGQGNSGRVGQ
jgi:hypothetical protein